MDLKVFITTFGMIFLAELGDKTQLVTLSFAAESRSRLEVFLGAAGALILTSLIGVLAGALITRWIPPNMIKIGVGLLFIGLGVWMVLVPSGR